MIEALASLGIALLALIGGVAIAALFWVVFCLMAEGFAEAFNWALKHWTRRG